MEEIIIRKIKPEDAEISWKWRNDPELWKYTDRSHTNYITKEIEQTWIEQILMQDDRELFAICIGKEQKYIGNARLCIGENNEATYHIFIGNKEYWKKGIAFDVTLLIVEYAQKELKLKKIIAKIHQNNQASIKFLTKAGFRKTEKTLGDFIWLDIQLSD